MFRQSGLTITMVLLAAFLITNCKEEIDLTHTQILTSLKPGVNNLSINYDGLSRELIIQLPSSFQQNKSYPLVFYFHGLNGKKENSQAIFGPIAEVENAIGVFPQAHLGAWNSEGNEVPSTTNDVGFTLKIIEMISKEINIDKNRIYTLGYSSGGAFSYLLAMRTDKFAAVASLSASLFANRTIDASVKEVSVIQMSGEFDPWVPYEGGQSAYLPMVFSSAMNSVKAWAVHNGINTNPIISEPFEKITLYTFSAIGNPYEVRLYKLRETNHEIGTHPYIYTSQCNKDIWEFFMKHPKVNTN